MSERERDSYRALGKYFYCLQPFVKAAKAGPPLTDSQVNTLGYKCLPELQSAARLRERYFSSMPQDPELHGDLSAPTRIARVKLHEKDLAAALWCDIRICSTM